jgi:hypothetical protein
MNTKYYECLGTALVTYPTNVPFDDPSKRKPA